MGFTNIKTKDQGFTIVELLIVVVVIAILAAITIVSYNGITNRANASAADSLVTTWRKKVELYQAEESRFPISTAELNTAGKSYQINNASLVGTNPTSSNGADKVWVQACAASGTTAPTASTVRSMKITYYDFDAATPAATTVVVGDATTATGAGCTTFS